VDNGYAEELARRAERANQIEPNKTWHVLVKGMGEHRAGRPQAAADWLKKYQQVGLARHAAGSVVADAFLALGHHRLGEQQEASIALQRALRRAAADLPPPQSGYVLIAGGSAEDWLMAQIALREAQACVPAPNPD
jgi:hypothetical protein